MADSRYSFFVEPSSVSRVTGVTGKDISSHVLGILRSSNEYLFDKFRSSASSSTFQYDGDTPSQLKDFLTARLFARDVPVRITYLRIENAGNISKDRRKSIRRTVV